MFNRRAMRPLLLALLLFVLPLSLVAQVAEGDRHYAGRTEGARGARAQAEPIDAAIAAYKRAVASNPEDLEAHWKLLRAYRYKGAYVAASPEEKRAIYGEAKTAGARAIAVLERFLAARGVNTVKAKYPEIVAASHGRRGIAETYLWDAINWGEWALAYGKLAAARQGAADRIRRQATIAMMIDPRLEGGAPSRVLGRLHDQTPRIPLITGWASSREAVRFLKESMKIDPSNKLNIVFLAEAMVSHDPRTRPEASAMLRTMIATPVDRDYPVEDAAAIDDAKALLAAWDR
jgi:tetratricopeptide (TPR) repeat protein